MRDVVEHLAAIGGRGACTDAERRAALWAHDDLRARGYEAWVETVWVRPQWAASLVIHATLGVAASLASTAEPAIGLGVAALALVSYLLEAGGYGGLLLRFFYRRATQVVVVEPPRADKITVLITATTDAPRGGLALREGVRRLGSRLWPGPLAWVVIALALVTAGAGARLAGAEGQLIGALQFVPTLLLLIAAAAALDVGLSSVTPGASDDASGVAVALALHEELTRRTPAKLSVGLVLGGAGELHPLALTAWLRREKPSPPDTVLIEVGPSGGGTPAWTTRHPQLVAAADGERLRLNRPSGASAARARRIPAINLRAVERRVPPRTRTGRDTAEAVDDAAMEAVYDAGLALVDKLDSSLPSTT